MFAAPGAIDAHVESLGASTAMQVASSHVITTFSAEERRVLDGSDHSGTLRSNGIWSVSPLVAVASMAMMKLCRKSAYVPSLEHVFFMMVTVIARHERVLEA